MPDFYYSCQTFRLCRLKSQASQFLHSAPEISWNKLCLWNNYSWAISKKAPTVQTVSTLSPQHFQNDHLLLDLSWELGIRKMERLMDMKFGRQGAEVFNSCLFYFSLPFSASPPWEGEDIVAVLFSCSLCAFFAMPHFPAHVSYNSNNRKEIIWLAFALQSC